MTYSILLGDLRQPLHPLPSIERVGRRPWYRFEGLWVEVGVLHVDGQHFLQQNTIFLLNGLVLVEEDLLFLAGGFDFPGGLEVLGLEGRAVVELAFELAHAAEVELVLADLFSLFLRIDGLGIHLNY